MKYVIKWNNGFWKLFNTQEYRDESMHGLRTDAEKACLRMNTQR